MGSPLWSMLGCSGDCVTGARVYADGVPQLIFTESELMQEHDYERPHVVAGRRMHGGSLANGSYQPPRALVREVALDAWTAHLRERGGELLDADSSLLDGERLPNT